MKTTQSLIFLTLMSVYSPLVLALPWTTAINEQHNSFMAKWFPLLAIKGDLVHRPKTMPLSRIKEMLTQDAVGLNPDVLNKVLMSMKCANDFDIDHNNRLTIIDYSLPSSAKRLWVFDLDDGTLLFHTHVAHGIRSGKRLTEYFSNKYNSKASSIGVYETDKAYYGREGLSLKLDGLDRHFNDQAMNRSIVMHGGWYVDEAFIKKYGRAGRSWGCPALPLKLSNQIINAIKDKTFFVAYYPDENWFSSSKFLTCDVLSLSAPVVASSKPVIAAVSNEQRDPIFFTDLKPDEKREEQEPVLVMAADKYAKVFKKKVPLTRMLRRQIEGMEYIALNEDELKTVLAQEEHQKSLSLKEISFVVPDIQMRRGYYVTEMKLKSLGEIKGIKPQAAADDKKEETLRYALEFEKKPSVHLVLTKRFIRWLGL